MTATPTGSGGTGPKRPADRLILRGYGPLAALIVVIILLTMLVPSRPKDDELNEFTGDTGFSAPEATTGELGAPAGSAPAGTTPLGTGAPAAPAAAPGKAGKAVTTNSAVGPATATSCSGGAKQDG